MTDEQDLPSDGPDADEEPEVRLQTLSAEYAQERAALAEQISQLQEENDCLKERVRELEQPNVGALPADDSHPERALGLDFSLSDERGKV